MDRRAFKTMIFPSRVLKRKTYDYLFQSLCPDPAYCMVRYVCRTRRRFFCPLFPVLCSGLCLPVDDLQSQAGITHDTKSGIRVWRRVFGKLFEIKTYRFSGANIFEQGFPRFEDQYHFQFFPIIGTRFVVAIDKLSFRYFHKDC